MAETENRIYNYNHVESTVEDPLRQNEEVEKKEGAQTCSEKVILFFKNVTVEPALFLFIVANMINSIAQSNLQLEKACRVNLKFNETICDALRAQELDASNQFERETQNLVATALTWKTYVSATVPTFIALFAGAFSDTTGHRKFFLILSITGQFLSGLNCIVNVYFMYQLNLEALIFSVAIIEGITGGWSICFMIAFTFVSAITTHEKRTFRLGLLGFCVSVAFPVGVSVSGIILKKLDYYGSFGLTSALCFLCLLYIVLFIRDPPRTLEQKKHVGRGICHLVREFFNLANIKESVKVILKNAPNQRRRRLCLLLGVSGVVFGPTYGELSVMYMLTRYRFGWDELQYSYFNAYNAIVQIFGMLLALMLFSRRLGWHDSMLGIIAIASKIAAAFVYCFAPNATVFYIAPSVEFMSGISTLAVKTMTSKLVEHYELGKVNSMTGLIENLTPLVYVPLYTNVYTATMEVLPGTVFLLGAGLILPAFAVMIWWFYNHRMQLSRSKSSRPV